MLILQLLLLVTSARIARNGANYSTTPRGDPNLDLQQLLLVQLSPFGEVTFLEFDVYNYCYWSHP